MNNKRATKRALLTSVMALAMCVVMLVGTTFAWFTDTAKTNVNRIQAGKLDVALEMKNPNFGVDGAENADKEWINAENKVLNFMQADAEGKKTASESILWEPGCTYELPELRVINNGNLALKYKIQITGAKDADNDENLNSLELLDVLKWTYKVESVEYTLDTEKNLTAGASETLAISAHMQETAGNKYMNMAIDSIAITVLATQDAVEYDSNGNTYDEDAPLDFVPVSSTEELKAVFVNAKAGETVNVSLNEDVTISNNELSVVNETQSGIGVGVGDIYINGNGHTIKTTNSGTRCVKIECSDTARNITISDAKIVSESTVGNTSENRGVQIFSVNNATINLVNCEIEMKSNDYSFPIKIGGTSENLTINITGCTLTGANCIDSYGKNCTVNITDCVFNSNYMDHEEYTGQGIQDKHGTNNTYNIKNTTFNGSNAQPWEGSENATTTFNDLGGNVNNMKVSPKN